MVVETHESAPSEYFVYLTEEESWGLVSRLLQELRALHTNNTSRSSILLNVGNTRVNLVVKGKEE